jgi:N-acetyl-gamma-glutamyl-phosphate reductase
LETELVSHKKLSNYNPDVIFLGLPHGISMEFVKEHQNAGYKIIDLSGDFRLSSGEVYEQWYNTKHIYPEGIDEAVFGLPELFSNDIAKAKLVANPGCFPTGAVLSLAPLVKNELIDNQHIIVDSKTGVTGAGIKPKPVNLYSNVADNFTAYGLKKHRHTVEMEETLSSQTSDKVKLLFTPHLLPVDRGILTTTYSLPRKDIQEAAIKRLYADFYKNEPFVRITNTIPDLKSVRGSNFIDIMVAYDERTNKILTVSALDNLVKGAAGQAVENMNIMFGLERDAGLKHLPLKP